jgi:glucose/arabinose dehydrogenase
MRPRAYVPTIAAALAITACSGGDAPPPEHGASPRLPEPRSELLPTMQIAEPADWGDRRPTVPQDFTIQAIATGLEIPRQTLVLPNGDILVAEGKGGGAPKLTPKDVIAAYIKAKGTSSVKGGDRLTLLRDADGDGVYETRAIFAEDLNAPYGQALTQSGLYVANQDSLVRFD